MASKTLSQLCRLGRNCANVLPKETKGSKKQRGQRNKGVKETKGSKKQRGHRNKGVTETKGSQKQRGQTSFSVSSGNGRTRGRPLGRIVDSRLSRLAIDSTQPSSPSGAPRFAQIRIAFNSLSDNGSLTRETQFGSRGIGHGDKNFGSGSDRWSQRQREPHRQSSARAVIFALNAFRST